MHRRNAVHHCISPFFAGIMFYKDYFMWNYGKTPKSRLDPSMTKAGHNKGDHSFPEIPFAPTGKVSFEEVFDVAKKLQALHEKSSYATERAVLDLRHADGPIGIVYSSDWHLGSLGCDYDQMRNDLDFVMKMPNIGLATVGDLKDNFGSFKNVSAVHGQAFPGELQNLVLKDIAERLIEANKLWIITWDNHSTEFDERVIGYEAASYIWREGVQKHKTIALEGEGYVELHIGNTFYSHLIMHKSKYHTSTHKLAGNKRLYQTRFPAHVVVTGHTHSPDFEQYTHYELGEMLGFDFGGRSYLIKTGTYKIKDTHSQRHYGQPTVGTPTVVYFPMEENCRKHLCFPNAEDAVRYMVGPRFLQDFHEASKRAVFNT
jgi:hypothetical protein